MYYCNLAYLLSFCGWIVTNDHSWQSDLLSEQAERRKVGWCKSSPINVFVHCCSSAGRHRNRGGQETCWEADPWDWIRRQCYSGWGEHEKHCDCGGKVSWVTEWHRVRHHLQSGCVPGSRSTRQSRCEQSTDDIFVMRTSPFLWDWDFLSSRPQGLNQELLSSKHSSKQSLHLWQ